jgi:hypothetical protein
MTVDQVISVLVIPMPVAMMAAIGLGVKTATSSIGAAVNGRLAILAGLPNSICVP